MSVLEVKNIKKTFGKSEILKGIDFSLEKGEVLAIIGSSGSGKTTLLRCLNFLEHPDEGQISVNGEVLFDGKDAQTQKESVVRKKRLHFGLVFQSFNLFPQYTVLKNVTLANELLAKDSIKTTGSWNGYNNMNDAKFAILENAEKIIESVGLSEKIDFYPHQLSGGQQQRVAIARALALSPDVLCFDEPTSALDPELTGEVLKVIKSLKNGDSTMVIVTHEIDFAHDVADKILFMADGVVEEYGTPEQVIDNPKSERTKIFLGKLNG